jgi:acetyl-CoA C-acetyltransferase
MYNEVINEVAIIGMGCTCFGDLLSESWTDLAAHSFREALDDAQIEEKDIDACWFNYHLEGINVVESEKRLKSLLGLSNATVSKTDNFQKSEMDAFHQACHAVASGTCSVALALGVEKLDNIGQSGFSDLLRSNKIEDFISPENFKAILNCAGTANRYFNRLGISAEDGRRAVARVSFKNYRNGLLNPRAYLRNDIGIDEIINAPIVVWPIGSLDCSQISNGAAAAIVCRANSGIHYRRDPIYVIALHAEAAPQKIHVNTIQSNVHLEVTYMAAVKAYRKAGIKKPREEISLLETQDFCSMAELMHCEDLLISPYGKVIEDMDSGFYDQDGKIPCQTDGGFKCFGDPIGASAIRMIYETYKQLQGKAENGRQINKPRIGLVHYLGGSVFPSIASIAILATRGHKKAYS